jgi:alpha-L-rhamnosidase
MTRSRSSTRTVVRSIRLFVLILTSLVMSGSVPTGATSPRSPSPQWPAHPDWQRYVEAPKTSDVDPTHIVSTFGSVSGAEALTDAGEGGATVLEMVAGGPKPTIVVDYGKDVSGVPYFVVRSESKSPVLRSSYSEGLNYLGPQGDNSPSLSNAGDSSRADNLIVSSPGKLSTDLIQGGERYERISLISPGTVTLSSIGIRFTAVRATVKDYKGWFDSSSRQLNRIWFDGAYTMQLDELPTDAVPGPWNIINGVLNGNGGGVGLLRNGTSWTNYTMSFDSQSLGQGAAWLVRAPSSSKGYLFVLDGSGDPAGSSGTLHEIALGGPNSATIISTVAFSRPINAGTWYRIQTAVSSTEIMTSIDGHEVSHFNTDSLPAGAPVYRSGSIGFLFPGNEANVKDLDITTPAGATLFANKLSRSTALADFTGPDLVTPDPLPIILDGAKRDRDDWSGDLGVSAPVDFYTTDADAYVRESLRLLGSYQAADGESAGQVSPTSALGTFPDDADSYSASYSMEEVDNIATYYLYTGDLAFVQSEWPMIARELGYDQSLVDSRGLLATDASNGRDWDYYDGAKTGEVTAYNDIYYETLKDASVLANALGMHTQSVSFSHEGELLRSAINQDLFDPLKGLYVVSNLNPTAVAQDANSLAVLYGVAPAGHDAAILRALYQALPSDKFGPLPFSANSGYRVAVSPYVTDQEVQASFTAGNTARAMSILQTVWGHMIAPGPDFTGADWELVGPKGAPGFGSFTSLAHGWASGATTDLSAYVLGVQPSSAGYRTWLVQPHPGSLSWVEGDVPTPKGMIAVRWAQDHATGRLALLASAPPGTTGIISVPVPNSGAVVTVRFARFGKSRQSQQSFTTVTGSTALRFNATGGVTYHFDVIPR